MGRITYMSSFSYNVVVTSFVKNVSYYVWLDCLNPIDRTEQSMTVDIIATRRSIIATRSIDDRQYDPY